MSKTIIKNIIKLIIGIGLIYWLFQSGKIDLEVLKEAFSSPIKILSIIALSISVTFIAALRWRMILESKAQEKLPMFSILKANWIGMFFNTVLPGSVTGDLVKIFFIGDISKKFSRKFLIASILLDRVVGVFGLISVCGIFSLLNYQELINYSEELKPLLFSNFVLFGIVILSFLSLFVFQDLPLKISKILKRISFLNGILDKLESLWDYLCQFRHKMIFLLIYSIVIQSSAIFIFWFATYNYASSSFSLSNAYSIIPIGFIGISLPIAPAGFGVGHAIFDSFFNLIGISNGADLFNIYFFYVVFAGLTGVIPYVFSKSTKISMKDILKNKINQK